MRAAAVASARLAAVGGAVGSVALQNHLWVSCDGADPPRPLKLVQVHVVFRHGARAPYTDNVKIAAAHWDEADFEKPSQVALAGHRRSPDPSPLL